jgi:hypothetical protein
LPVISWQATTLIRGVFEVCAKRKPKSRITLLLEHLGSRNNLKHCHREPESLRATVLLQRFIGTRSLSRLYVLESIRGPPNSQRIVEQSQISTPVKPLHHPRHDWGPFKNARKYFPAGNDCTDNFIRISA